MSRSAAREPLILVSGNPNKAIEAQRLLGVPLQHASIDLPEIQSASVEEITRHKLSAARAQRDARLIVEDVSLGFDELGNFPGPFVRWLLEAAGGEGLAAIASGLRDRAATAQCCVGYWDGRAAYSFLGETAGEILLAPRGERRFGWDPWFVPAGTGRTFAEMSDVEKDAVSHRGKAYRKLAEHLASSDVLPAAP